MSRSKLTDHGFPMDSRRNDMLANLARDAMLPVVATNSVHYATGSQARLAATMAAIRARCTLDELDGWLAAAPTAHLRSGTEMAEQFARYPKLLPQQHV